MDYRYLFVVPQLSAGGSNKSLETIFSLLKDDFEGSFSVLSLNDDKEDAPYYRVFSDKLVRLGHLYRFFYHSTICRKSLNAVNNFMHIDLWKRLYRYEARRLQSRYHFDKVIGFEESYATKFASCFDIPKIAWLHCDYHAYYKASQGLDESAMYGRFEKIVCVSNYAKNVFIKYYPALSQKVICVYNMLDVSAIEAAAQEPIEDNRFETEDFTIVSVGRIDPIKQFHLIPDFVKEMKNRNPVVKFRWYVIGNGSNHLWNYTLEQIKKLGVSEQVVLLGAKNNPYPYIQKADLLVCTSKTESWSYVINEAKVLHTPVVTLRCGSSEEVVEPNVGYITTKEKLPTILVRLIKDENGEYSRIKQGVRSFEYNNYHLRLQIKKLLG